MTAWDDYKAIARERGALSFELYVVTFTPTGSPDAIKAALPEHLEYIQGLEIQGSLVMAGPLSNESGTENQGAGQMVLRADSMEEATKMAENDPMHLSGARNFTLRKWLVNEGSLSVTVGLSTGRVSLK